MIIQATTFDADILTNIALLSKGYWGYTKNQLQSWKEDLTVSSKMIDELIVFKFVIEDTIVGFYILNQPKNNRITLEFLFIHPNFIGQKIGSKLLNHAIKIARNLNVTSINLLADPNAVPFYKNHGVINIGKKESSIPNRYLPVLEKTI